MRSLATIVVFLLFAASARAADPNDITAYLTERNNGVRPSDAYIADFLVSDAGVEWRRVRGLLPPRTDVPPTGTGVQPTGGPAAIQGRRWTRRRRTAGHPDGDNHTNPGANSDDETVGANTSRVTPSVVTPVAETPDQPAASLADAPPPRLPNESEAAYRERVGQLTVDPSVTTPQISEQQQARTEQSVKGMTGLFQALFKPADPETESMSAGAASSPGSKGSRGGASLGGDSSMEGAGADARMSMADLQVAQAGGLGQPFRDMGLKVGSGPGGRAAVLRADGTPASASEVGELQKRLTSEPLAQMQRPDFHQVIPRDKFQELRAHYATKPELRGTTFKDVVATPEVRDFQWGRTCSGLDGGCNSNAMQGAYSKGRYVAPEDLKNMSLDATKRIAAGGAADKKDEKPRSSDGKSFWERLRQEDEEYRKNAAQERGRRQPDGAASAGGRGFGALLSALSRALGGGGQSASSAANSAVGGAESPEYGEPGYALDGEDPGVERRASRNVSDRESMRRMPDPPTPPVAKREPRIAFLRVFMAGLAALLVVFVWRRVRERT